MHVVPRCWDYLIVTASNDRQAETYRMQLSLRGKLGLLCGAGEVMVVADPGGKRVGSGASTIHCLINVLNAELASKKTDIAAPELWRDTLSGLRVLIIHAGGDSKRLPAYGVCGKLFIPIPGQTDTAVCKTLFDCQLPRYLSLPPSPPGRGQIVITAGDVLLSFDASKVDFASDGIIGLGCQVSPEQASGHGVYCADGNGDVRLFLQKPTPAEQAESGAIDRYGNSTLDIGVMSFDAETAVKLLQMCGTKPDAEGKLSYSGDLAKAIMVDGLDFYREIACALGSEATKQSYIEAARKGNCGLDEQSLEGIFEALSGTAFSVRLLPHCDFLHFGTNRQIISSGIDLLGGDLGPSQVDSCLDINNEHSGESLPAGSDCWVEGCRLSSGLTLEGENIVVGVDVDQPLSLPRGACLDVLEGRSRSQSCVWFIRCYSIDDTFKNSFRQGIVFCGRKLNDWLEAVGASPEDIWDENVPIESRTLWNARLFCAEKDANLYRNWLWMFEPACAPQVHKLNWLNCERYSLAQTAELADGAAFYDRRMKIRSQSLAGVMRKMFRNTSGFSFVELAHLLGYASDRCGWFSKLLAEAQYYHDCNVTELPVQECFIFSRIIHTLGSAIEQLADSSDDKLSRLLPCLPNVLSPATKVWMKRLGLTVDDDTTVGGFAGKARAAAFAHLERMIITSGARCRSNPVSKLRRDEIVWARAPARLDIGGGWTDTPPYSLENGGCVLNAAVNLNGQPPIQAYARVINEPVIRIASIDLGLKIEISQLEQLMDYRKTYNGFALAKAAFALSGFSHEAANWPKGYSLSQMLQLFGGGIELTTLAAIPKGSGLGTSSIMAAVMLAVIQRLMGQTFSQKQLFHDVLRLEQALGTGGGWQDQIGGALGGVKLVTTEPCLVPDAAVRYLPSDVLEPRRNGGRTLLYYTGITRLAKDILEQVVGRYLNRDRLTVATLKRIDALARKVADAVSRKDIATCGELVAQAWQLNKQLDPNSTNDRVEALFARVQPHIYGAKLLGAGGGGFMLMICKSEKDADIVRSNLENEPPNELARFFDFSINNEGLVVTVC